MVLSVRFCDPKIVVQGIERLFLQKIHPGIYSSSGRIFFFAVASACNWIAVVAFVFIQISAGSPVIEAINAGSSSLFRRDLVGFSLVVIFFSKCHLNSWGDRVLSLKKNLRSLVIRQVNSPVFQLMSGFC